jgi:hypothetical protein
MKKKGPDSGRNDSDGPEDRVGTIEELLALDPKNVKAIQIGDGPWIETHSVDELREMRPASSKIQ